MDSTSGQNEARRERVPRAWRYVLVLAGVALAVGLFYAEENWRGRRAWEKYAQELVTKGQPVRASDVIPPIVPDDENFAMTLFLAPLFDFVPGKQEWRDTNAYARIQNFASEFNAAASEVKNAKSFRSNTWMGGEINLHAWHLALQKTSPSDKDSATRPVSNNLTTAEAARGVLASLAQYDPVIEELRAASRRPYCRFKLNYGSENPAAVLLPHLAVLKRVSQLLQVRVCAELAVGQTEQAFADLNLMLYLADCLRNEPVLISHLVRVAEFNIALQPLAQGLANHQWSDAQLAAFEDCLGKFKFCEGGRNAMQSERALFGGGIIDFIREAPNKFSALKNLGGAGDQNSDLGILPLFFTVAPEGWLYLEKLHYFRAFENHLVPIIDGTAQRVSPEAARNGAAQMEAMLKQGGVRLLLRHQFFISFLMPALSSVAQRTAYAQAAADAAALACGLERYRLARNEYPTSLNALSPEFIAQVPRDVITGQPLKYRRTDDGQYLLYSVGWNEVDDGGVIATKKKGQAVELKEGDWVWSSVVAPEAE